MKMACVYLITVGNDKQYVGVTTNFTRRMREHLSRDSLIGRAIKVHGVKETEILVCDVPFNEALRIEKHEIDTRRTLAPRGYNVTEGGYGSSGCPTPPHVVEQRRETMKRTNAATPPHIREANWKKGIAAATSNPWTEERKAKHSARMREQHARNRELGKPSPTAKAVQKAAATWTQERRHNLSLSRKGKPWTPAQHAARQRRKLPAILGIDTGEDSGSGF